MKKLEININDPEGLHARPASRLVSLCHSIKSDVTINFGGTSANGRNITEVLALGAEKGDLIRVLISGSDEEGALSALKEMLAGNIAGKEGSEHYGDN
jgi:phosphocarrier protein